MNTAAFWGHAREERRGQGSSVFCPLACIRSAPCPAHIEKLGHEAKLLLSTISDQVTSTEASAAHAHIGVVVGFGPTKPHTRLERCGDGLWGLNITGAGLHDSELHAKLVAEMTAAFLCAEAGLLHGTLENSAADLILLGTAISA